MRRPGALPPKGDAVSDEDGIAVVAPVAAGAGSASGLAGTSQWGESPFDRLLPRPLMPVAEVPLIQYALCWLRDAGISRVTVCANSASREVRGRLADGSRLSVHLDYYEDWTPRGAAGCARDAGLHASTATLILTEGTIIPTIDLRRLIAAHVASQAALTVVVNEDARGEPGARPATPGRRPASPVGIYVLERRVLDRVPATGFQDLKEGLIPRLYQAGEAVRTFPADGPCPRVLGPETYLAVNGWMVERAAKAAADPLPAGVAASVRIVGPVRLARDARVDEGATIVGPTSIGSGSTVGEGAVVSRSVLWQRCAVGPRAVVDRCILADGAVVAPGATLSEALRTSPDRSADVFRG